jgi:3-hydroxyisobutyrate dehydrogenase
VIVYFGLGRMGLPMAGHAHRSGQTVVGYDPDPARRALFAQAGGTAVDDATAACTTANAIVVMVGAETEVERIIAGPGGVIDICRTGTLVLIVSTVSPNLVQKLAERAAASGIRIVDAPVCRAEMGAIKGQLLTFLAGPEADCKAAAELMQPYSADIQIVGTRPGAAQVAKTVNNMILWACAIANEEGLRLADKWQLDVEALRRALVTSSADNWCLRHWDQIDEMIWSIKDMDIACETAQRSDVAIPLADTVSRLVRTSTLLSHP